MATSYSSRLAPPGEFDFAKPDQWPVWKKRFEQFRSASGLDAEPETRQVDTLLYCLGGEADSVLTSTNITDEDRKEYQKVIDTFDTHFKVRRNTIFERARFNRRSQKEGESSEQYITELYRLIEFCEYGVLKEEMLRDRLVVGIRDTALSEKLQTESGLTLQRAKTLIRQKEAAKEHRRELQDTARESTLGKIGSRRFQKRSTSGGGKPQSRKGTGAAQSQRIKENECSRCGRDKHQSGERCPAVGATCHFCQKKGHFSAKCYKRAGSKTTVGAVVTGPATSDSAMEEAFLGNLTAGQPQQPWMVDLEVRGHILPFKLDTGAEVTAITEQTYNCLGKPKLNSPSRVLYGPARQSLCVLGELEERLTKGDRSTVGAVYVIKGLKSNLLSLQMLTALQLIRRVDTISWERDIKQQFPTVFQGLGVIGDEYRIKLKEDAIPYALQVPRNVPIPLRPKVKEELDRMEKIGVISRVDKPTDWCAGMVVVPKKTGAVRICVDLKPLNSSVLREPHPIPTVDDTLALLSGATHFSKLDANSGFWQVPLAEESRHLTTFITPFGRYQFNKLPFGISSAPELFQRRMSRILDGLEGVVCLIDDVLVFGKNQEEHDARLLAVFKRLEEANVTLNGAKCEFNKPSVKFLGHVVDRNGIRPDPEKTTSILRMPAPRSVSEVRRFMGLVNQLGKFSSRIAEISQPLRELLRIRNAWHWGPDQEASFEAIKQELVKPTVLAMYDPQAQTKVSADASSYGLGAVLLQSNGNGWKAVAYASRALSDTERRYAQIEKEALASTWACEKFSNYILGRPFLLESDHKPLIPLLNTKHLDDLPPRILRFRLRMAKFEYTAQHVAGKLLYAADALSRAPESEVEVDLQEEAEAYVEHIAIPSLPATPTKLECYRQAQKDDDVCAKVREYCQSSWPKRDAVESELKAYWKVRNSLTLCDDILLYNNRIVVPAALRKETLSLIHQGHQGVERSRLRAKAAVWWPCVSSEVKQYVESCRECAKQSQLPKAPLIPTPLPDYPWQQIGTDLFELGGQHYFLVVDYFSRFPEVIKLTSTTSASVITMLKSIFSRHGIPEVVRSDNGPQFTSNEFTQFAQEYGFRQVTSSPHYPQSNGAVERMVQTVKGMLKKSSDPHLALLAYRATPMPWCGLSPSELCMGRRLRTTVPQSKQQLTPTWPYLTHFRSANAQVKAKQKENFDNRNRVHEPTEIQDDADVWVRTDGQAVEGRVIGPADTPRSYIVETPAGEIRRNQSQLTVVPSPSSASQPITDPETEQPNEQSNPSPPRKITTRSKTGVTLHPPVQYGL